MDTGAKRPETALGVWGLSLAVTGENVLEKIEPLVSTGVSLVAMVTGVIFSDTLDERLSLARFRSCKGEVLNVCVLTEGGSS